jgi:hypothetical protein
VRESEAVAHVHGSSPVSGSFDQTVKIWNIETGVCQHTLGALDHSSPLFTLAFPWLTRLWHRSQLSSRTHSIRRKQDYQVTCHACAGHACVHRACVCLVSCVVCGADRLLCLANAAGRGTLRCGSGTSPECVPTTSDSCILPRLFSSSTLFLNSVWSALAITTPLSFPQRSVVLSPPILNPTIKHALPATIKAFNGVGLAFFWTGWWLGGGVTILLAECGSFATSALQRSGVLPNGRRKWF